MGPNGIGNDLAFPVHELLVEVSDRGESWPEPHLYSRSKAALHVDAAIVVLELGLGAQDHEEELLVRIVPETLAERPDLPPAAILV